MIAPGGTIGILGGGQLGRMLALSAAQLGYRCHVYAPEADSVAADVVHDFTCADYRDREALSAFAAACDVVTYEFENVPVDALDAIAAHCPLYPGLRALDIAQSRIAEKSFVRDLGGRTAPFTYAATAGDVAGALAAIGGPAIAKTDRMGYDGKGQARLSGQEDPAEIWAMLGGQPLLVEGLMQFEQEFSIILVRGADGEIRYWPANENVHEQGILALTTVPATGLVLSQEAEARAMAAHIAEALDYVGVLTCEFFAGADGPVFNEMAPRVHNSGHWTTEGAIISQFENHIRAICGLPLGETGLAAASVRMNNLIGAQALDIAALFADPNAHVHLYGKAEARDGRKMGHVTRLYF